MRRGEKGLTRDCFFGDEELQQAAAEACAGLDLTAATDVLEYAYRLIPIIENTDYFSTSIIKWEPQLMEPQIIIYENDGVWTIYYDKKISLSANYEELTEQERHGIGIFHPGMYIMVSSGDGHIISLQDSYNGLIEGKTETSRGEETPVPPLKYQPVDIVYLNDVSLGQHFTGWTGETGERYKNAPREVSVRFADEALQDKAAEACTALRLDTIEGMSNYAWRLGEVLRDTEYQMSAEGFDVGFLTRYTDGAWEIRIRYPVDPQNTDGETYDTYVYVSEKDGHIICMFDADGQLISK